MDQNDSNFGTGSSGSMGTPGTGSGTSTGAGMNSGASGSGAFGMTSASETTSKPDVCPHCGHAKNAGLEQLLGRLGINDEMINNLKGQFQNVDIDEYLNTAREYLKDSSGKASTYAKENPGRVAAGVAALALGAGLIYAAVNRDK